MPLSAAYLWEVEEKLGSVSPSMREAFREAYASLPADLPDDRALVWANQGVELAGHSLRSWEAGADYFRASPAILPLLDDTGFVAWVHAGRDLAALSSAVGTAFFRASPAVVPRLAGTQVAEWAAMGERLYKATWKSIALVGDFYARSPLFLENMTLGELARFARVLESISDRSADLAAACLAASPIALKSLDHTEWTAFVDFAAAVADSSWPEASLYFERGPELVRNVKTEERAHYLELATRVARRLGRQAYGLFAEGALALKDVDTDYHGRLIGLADRLVALSPIAAMSLLKSAPVLTERLRPDELEAWHEAGLEILRQTVDGGEAYFRLESGKAEQTIQTLSARVDLQNVNELLRLYGKALTGANIAVQPISALEEKGIGWVRERGPTTEGSSVYLPDYIEKYETKTENFSIYKVYATHQTAHIEFGSFDFGFGREGTQFPRTRQEIEKNRLASGEQAKDRWLTDAERFFDLFADRRMAADIFTIAEDLRIDSRIDAEYGGIRKPSGLVREAELALRPDVRTLPLRQAFVENLIRASLNGKETITWPDEVMALLLEAIATLDRLRDVKATVEDSAEATIIVYDIAASLKNLPPEMLEEMGWEDLDEEMSNAEGEGGGEGQDMPEGQEMPYESPQQVDFRGDFKPELVQLLMRMKLQKTEDMEGEDELSPLTAEQIKELLEKSVEVEMDFDQDDMSEFNQMLENLEKEAGQHLPDADSDNLPASEDPGAPDHLPPEVKTYYYDEWDFRASDYKPRWCAVRERIMDEGTEDFYEKTLRQHASLINETQRQFEMLKPETFRKMKRLEDGEDVDLDHAIEFIVQKRAGHGDVQKIYWRRNKVERDVAVAFLLDMSASTDEEVDKHRPKPQGSGDSNDPRRYFQTLAQVRNSGEPPKRIIDMERESIVLLTRALEVIHDRYGIYGFSGYGRENVEYFVIKDLDEAFDDVIRRRIDQVSPIRSTRMGPAIRHTVHKLDQSDARAKILFLVSDGRPQDHGYGRDRTEKEYAIHDTHKALVEAKHKGIVPFALTVDKEGHDYLGQMCGDIAYEVLGDIELLPSRLPTLYRKLTE